MKKIFSFVLCLTFIVLLTACTGATNDVIDDAQSMGESVVSDTKSAVDDTKSAITEDKKSMNLMAGITANEAKEAALKHAGLEETQVSDVDVDLDRDNGKLIYEVDFNSGNTEYDYDIDAETGEVISADKSRD